jgi:hypothetical protein
VPNNDFEEFEVILDSSMTQDRDCVSMNESLIESSSRKHNKPIKFDILDSFGSDQRAGVTSIVEDRGLTVASHRILRMPDDEKIHQLPASLGAFPV